MTWQAMTATIACEALHTAGLGLAEAAVRLERRGNRWAVFLPDSRIGRALSAYERIVVEPADCVLRHTDVGLHNLAVDPAGDAVAGVFDYDSAAWADRHHDFRYIVFHERDDAALEAAIAIYETAVG